MRVCLGAFLQIPKRTPIHPSEVMKNINSTGNVAQKKVNIIREPPISQSALRKPSFVVNKAAKGGRHICRFASLQFAPSLSSVPRKVPSEATMRYHPGCRDRTTLLKALPKRVRMPDFGALGGGGWCAWFYVGGKHRSSE